MSEYDIKSRYALSKKTGVYESTLKSIVDLGTAPEKITLGTARKLSNGLGMDLEEFENKIKKLFRDSTRNNLK